MIISLENLDGFPDYFFKRLAKFDNLFEQFEFLENFETNEGIHNLIIEINDYCLRNKIVGFHFTNAIEKNILDQGLAIRTGKEIRESFIKNHFHLFTKDEQNKILIEWKKEFDESDVKSRDNRIFFNFTKHALYNRGAELLLRYYGGEQVYFPLYKIPQIGQKLENIGEPMILKCTLDPNEINTFIEYPWGKIIVSSYHRTKNLNAYLVDQDGYQRVDVSKDNVEIIKYKKHFC